MSDDPVIDEAEDEVVPAPEDEVPAFEDMSTEGTYTVNINITNKDVNIDPVKLDLGVVAEKISLEGYSFSNAMVNGKEVKAVRTWEDEKYVQYADGSVDKLTDTITVNMEAKEEEENVPAKAPVEEKAPEAPVNEEKAPEPETTYYEVKFFDQIVVDGTLQKAETPITTQWIKDGELAVAPGTVCPEGYAFTGWSGDVNSPITKNTEFVAQYAKNEAPIKLTINYVFEGSEMVAAQPWVASVKKGDFKHEVTFPVIEGCKATIDGEEVTSYTFDNPDKDTTVTVVYKGEETSYTVEHIKLNPDGKTTHSTEKETLTGGLNTLTNGQAKSYDGYTAKAFSQITITRGCVLKIYYAPKEYQITYQTGEGGSYTEPVSVYVDQDIPEAKTPTALGKTFKGWTYTKDGKTYDGKTMPAGDLVATANWEENTKADYKVVYWQENLNGGYDLARLDGKADIVTGNGNVGDQITWNTSNHKYEGFKYNKEKTEAEPATITADGQAVKNVYYDRETYTIKFMVKSNGNWTEDENRRITAKYGENITASWQKSSGDYLWAVERGDTECYTTFVNMPAKNITTYQYSENGSSVISYYVETVDGTGYHLHQQAKGKSSMNLSSADQQPIDGFEYKEWGPVSTNWWGGTTVPSLKSEYKGLGIEDKDKPYTGAYLIYSRKSYTLHFENCTGVADKDVKFEDTVEDKLPTDPKAPATVDSHYTFAGWYLDPGFQTPVTADQKMPSHTLQVYAKWEKPSYIVTYNTNKEGVTVDPVTLKKGEVITAENLSDSDFRGWYTDANFNHKFVEGTQIGHDVTLYAKWASDEICDSYTIKCVDENGKSIRDEEVVRPEGGMEVGTSYSATAPEIEGYYPHVTNQSFVVERENNVVTFVYSPVQSWTYTVKFVDENGNAVKDPQTVSTTDSIVQVTAPAIEDYTLQSEPVAQVAKSDESHEIVFKYACRQTTYTVEYYKENVDGTFTKYDTVTKHARIGDYVTAENKAPEGDYSLKTPEKQMSAAVKANGATVIRVEYVLNTHTVSYKLPEGFEKYVPASSEVKTGTTVTVADAPVVEGYTFNGWTLNGESVDSFQMPAKDVTLEGTFSRDFAAVTVDAIDKTYSGESYSLTVTGTKPEDTVKFYDEKDNEITNSFRNVSQSGTVKVVVTNGNDRKELSTTVTIAPLAVTLTSGTKTWTYDGESHSEPTVTVTENEFVTDEEPSYTNFASITNAGTKDNTFDYTFPEGVEAGNYTITKQVGKLIVKKTTAEIVVKDGDKELGAEGIHRIYDGTTSTITASTTAEGTTFTYYVDGQEVNASELAFKDVVNTEVTVHATNPNYTFEDVTVPVVITVRGVTISSKDLKKKYDGSALTNGDNGLTATNFVEGEGIKNVAFTGSVTDAGSAPNAYTYTLKDNTKASNYTITEKTGTLTVEKRNVTLTSATDSKVYDGTPLTNGTVNESGDGFAEGEGAVYTVTGTQTLPGESDNTFTYELASGTKADNYNITTTEGTLTVTDVDDADKYEVTVTAGSDTVKYDGKAHTVSGVEGTNFEWKGHTYTVTGLSASATGTDAGTYENKVTGTAKITDKSGNDVTNQFKLKTVDGALTIEKRHVTLTSADDSKVYDGSPLTNDTVTVSGEGFAEGEGASYHVTGSQTLPGAAKNTFTYKLADNTSEDNYVIDTKLGTLTVTDVDEAHKYEVTVTANSDKATYDGSAHTAAGVDTTSFEWKGHTYTVTGLSASATGTDAGTYENKVTGTAVIKDESGIDVTNQFKVKTVDGSLVIEKRQVVLTSADDSKVYDGSPLTNNTVNVSGDGFAAGEGAVYTVTGTQTLPGESDNTFTYELASGTKAANYNITVVPGTLTVTNVDDADKYEVTVTAGSDTVKYDGKAHTVSGVQGTAFSWNGHTYTVKGLSADVTGTNAGTYANEVTGIAVITDESGNDVTKQFKVKTVDGSLVIEKRHVTLTSADDSKVYDGTPLSNETVTVGGDGFVEGEEPEYLFPDTSRPVNVGTYDNAFEAEISSNYDADFEFGTLEITKAQPSIDVTIDGSTIGAQGYTRMYDGTTSSITATAKNQDGDDIDGQFTYSVDGQEPTDTAPEFTNSGKWEVTITTANPNCEETSVTVTIEITKRHVHMKSADAEKVYDGKAIAGHDTVEITGDGFVAGEEPVFHSFGTYIEAGEYDNTFAYKFNKRPSASLFSRVVRYLNPSEDPDHIADNYEITHETGKIVIRKASSELHNLSFEDKTVIYNGKEQSLEAAASDIKDARIEYSVDEGKTWSETMPAFTDAGKYTVKARAVHGNYEDAEKTAVLTVIPAELIVETESAAKEYDGKPLTAGGKLSGAAEGDVITLKVTGSQTEVGKSPNTYELDYGNAKASNYTVTEKIGVLEVTAAPKKKEDKPKQDVPTALGLDLNLWTSIMGVSGAAMITTVKLSRKEKNKKNKK